jgi:hypothetical protein
MCDDRPASTYACCTCPEAIQRKPCKHHIAWLFSQSPDIRQPEAVRMGVQMLGTHLAFASGCIMVDTSSCNLFHALLDLHVWSCAKMVASPDMPDNHAPGQENNHAPGQENVLVNAKTGEPLKSTPPGAVAMQNNVCKMLQMVNAQREQIA